MIYSQAFFELQIPFARTAARLTSMPFHQALLEYTNFYIRFGLGRDFRPENPTWRSYVDDITPCEDLDESTYRFYLAHGEDSPPASSHACFSYVMQGPDCVRIHFQNAEPTGSPLDIERLPARCKELQDIFSYIGKHEPQVRRVVGTRGYTTCPPTGDASLSHTWRVPWPCRRDIAMCRLGSVCRSRWRRASRRPARIRGAAVQAFAP